MCELQSRDRAFNEVACRDEAGANPGTAALRRRIQELMTSVVRRAREAGALRRDFGLDDLALLVLANAGVAGASADPAHWHRHMELMLDALHTTPRPRSPPQPVAVGHRLTPGRPPAASREPAGIHAVSRHPDSRAPCSPPETAPARPSDILASAADERRPREGERSVVKLLGPGDPQVLGPYRLLRVLGAGGMGRVFLGRSPHGRMVAVKLVHPQLAAEPEFRRRFEREVAAARRVGGRWTAPVLDADTTGELPWVATGYVAGPTLRTVVDELHGPLPEATVWRLTSGLAEALTAVHEAGLVHRDLKPSNVLVTVDGPKVIDFGIARAADASVVTRTGAVIGSPGFMSPEQVRGERVGPAGDVFSLGSVLVYAAGGAGPFDTEDGAAHSLLYRVVSEEPELGPLEGALRTLVARCLAKDPAERPGPAEIARLAAGHAAGQGPWLPPELTHRLARDAAELLALEGPALTQLAAPPPEPPLPGPGHSSAPTMTAAPAPHPTPPPEPRTAPEPRTVQGPSAGRRGRSLALAAGVLGAVGALLVAFFLLRDVASPADDVKDGSAGGSSAPPTSQSGPPTEPAGDATGETGEGAEETEEEPTAGEVPQPGEEGYFEGVWAGTIVVGGAFGAEYDVEVDYAGGGIGDTVATVRYRDACEGTWRLEEEGEEAIRVYERITQGRENCSNEEITLTAVDPFTASIADEDGDVAGELKRQ
nr:serine/threonine-protein kinase [Streptomyces hoynatensis]